jgi:hypothetical protein
MPTRVRSTAQPLTLMQTHAQKRPQTLQAWWHSQRPWEQVCSTAGTYGKSAGNRGSLLGCSTAAVYACRSRFQLCLWASYPHSASSYLLLCLLVATGDRPAAAASKLKVGPGLLETAYKTGMKRIFANHWVVAAGERVCRCCKGVECATPGQTGCPETGRVRQWGCPELH